MSPGAEGEPVVRLSCSCAALALQTPCAGRLLQTSRAQLSWGP